MSSTMGGPKSHWKKAAKITLALFFTRFNTSKCKTAAKLAVARMKLLRNKREVVVRQMRRDIALLLQSGQDATARIRVEHVLREQNILAANEFIELFCELIVQRLSIISKQRECPADLKEGISSLIFAAPRCSEIPELVALRDIFEKKYGKDFVSAATDLRPDCGVNRMLIDKLSVRTPAGEVKLKVLKEIAKEYQVEWDTTESETELLKPPEKTLDGPQNFMSASSMPIKPTSDQYVQPVKVTSEQFFQQNNPPPRRYSGNGQNGMHFEDTNTAAEQFVQPNNPPSRRYSSNGQNAMNFEDTKSAAEAAAESAKMAIAAAEAAAYLANKHSNQSNQSHESINCSRSGNNFDSFSSSPPINFTKPSRQSSDRSHISSDNFTKPSRQSSDRSHISLDNTKDQRRYSYNAAGVKFDDSDCDDEQPELHDNKMYRRHTYNAPPRVSSVKFDESESEYDEEIDMDHDYDHDHDRATRTNPGPPNQPAPPAPSAGYMKQGQQRVHPKLPDYDTLAARFEALKHGKA